MVRRGAAPIAFRIRSASIITALPAALSVAPVPVCHESKWPPSITSSSASLASLPGSSAMMFTLLTWRMISASSCSSTVTGRLRSTSRAIRP